MTTDPKDPISRLYEIAAFERPLTDVERLEVGLDAHLDRDHVAELWEIGALERPLDQAELAEIELDLRDAA